MDNWSHETRIDLNYIMKKNFHKGKLLPSEAILKTRGLYRMNW